jgi:pantetheine-phosphate adenylyltransferase
MKIAFYPGSFDPITLGHLDIVDQALPLFDEVYIAIGHNAQKKRMFSIREALELIDRSIVERWPDPHVAKKISYGTYSGSLITAAEEAGASAILRGIRQVSDFNDEFRLNGVIKMVSEIPVIYSICRHQFLHVASSTVKEMSSLGHPVDKLVTKCVDRALKEHYDQD